MEHILVVTKLFNRRWWLTTLLVIAGVIVLIRLGEWQLDRRDQKRALNIMMARQWQMEPFNINREPLPADLEMLEYRRIQAAGKYDYAHQVVVKNAIRDGVPGVNLLTPLVLEDGRAVLVARGWIPYEQSAPEFWPQFDEPTDGPIVGLIKESQTLAGAENPTTPQQEWFRVDIAALQTQMPYELLPAFIAQLPEPGRSVYDLPMRASEPVPLDETMHVSYAWQWFLFGLILAFGYLQFIVHQERRVQRLQHQGPLSTEPANEETDMSAAPRHV